jgi:hypothetical protein
MLAGLVMIASFPPASRKAITASILGAMLPGAKWRALGQVAFASSSVIRSTQRCSGVPKSRATARPRC